MAFRAPLLGYNTNVRHAGKLYHIQTEDSGIDHPHVITHLFADGGRIVASKKTSYADRVGGEGLPDLVKKLMQAQHKAMFIALRDGIYDEDSSEDVDEQTGPRKLTPELQQAIAAEPSSRLEPETATPAVKSEPAGAPTPAPITVARASSSAEPTEELTEEAMEPTLPPAQPPPQPPPVAKRPAATSAIFKAPKSEPGNLETHGPRDTVVTKAPNAARSLFGADLLSDKSLDEVILNYLAANEKDG
ncbi:MAG: hypothetical protein JWN48_859 [Myxococcaceae bacterium]|nr:hypothetical protein [Myxococcaceae bacterium]